MARTSALRAPAAEETRPAPRLAVVTRPRPQSSSVPFTLLCTVIAVAALAAVLFLNIQMSDMSYQVTRLEGQSQRLSEQQQDLSEQNQQLGTPQELEKRAREIGMVPVSEPAYIDLATGTVIGETDQQGAAAQEATDPASPDPVHVPPAQMYDEPRQYHGMGNEGA